MGKTPYLDKKLSLDLILRFALEVLRFANLVRGENRAKGLRARSRFKS